jgi:multicomponent K+:H+ antiporter subunit D
MERGRSAEADIFAVTLEAFGDDEETEHEEEVGVAIPATMVVLAISFATCAILLAGMPPLGGFVGKFAMLSGMLGSVSVADGTVPAGTWWLMGLLIVSGLATMIAMLRTGINRFWAPTDDHVPRVRVVEIAPIALLLGLSVVLALTAGSVMSFLQTLSDAAYDPGSYVQAVLGSIAGGGQ